MFEQPRFIQNSFTLTFSRYLHIRRKSNEFEDLLKGLFEGRYGQPQVISVPDELDPEVPRLIFSSKHGFSQIIISQITITLNVTYSPDWQTDISKGAAYLKERTEASYKLHELLKDSHILYSGFITRCRLSTKQDDSMIINHLKQYAKITEQFKSDETYDIMFKITTANQDKYYNNITVQNYRTWNLPQQEVVPRLSRTSANERGIEIIGDYNDRYSYNEKDNYISERANADHIIDLGLEQVQQIAEMIMKIEQ